MKPFFNLDFFTYQFKKHLSNLGWLLIDKVFRVLSAFFVSVWVARYLGPKNYGLINFAQSLVGLFGSISTFGLSNLLSRDFIKQEGKIQTYFSTSIGLFLIGSTITYIFICFFLIFHRYDPLTNFTVLILGLGLFFQLSVLFEVYYQSQLKARIVALSGAIAILIMSLVKIYLITMKFSFEAFIYALFFDSVLLFFIQYLFFKKTELFFSLSKFSLKTAKKMLRLSWPFMLSGIFIAIYMKIDQIMIKELMGDFYVGQYAAAVKLSECWYFVPMLILNAFYPSIAKAHTLNRNNYIKKLNIFYALMFYLSILIILFVNFFAKFLILTLFGESYSLASDVLIIHIWSSVFVFIGVASSAWVLTEGLQAYLAINTLIGAILNILLNFLLIPNYGIVGVAWATFISYACSSYFCLALWKKTRPNFFAIIMAIFKPLQLLKINNK